jgi:hypothetical protein
MRIFWRQGFFAAMRRTAAYFNIPPARIGRWAWPDMDISRLTLRKESAGFVERLVAVGGMDGRTAVEIGIELGLIPDSVKPDQVLVRLREQGGGL